MKHKFTISEYIRNFLWICSYYNIIDIFFYALLLIGAVFSEMLISVVIGNIIGNLARFNQEININSYIYKMIFWAIFSTTFEAIINIYRIRVKERPIFSIQKDTLKCLFDLGIPYFERREKENTFSIYSSVIPMVSEVFNKCIPELLRNIITVIISLYLFVKYSGWICLIVVLAMVPSLLIHKFFTNRITEITRIQIRKHKIFSDNIMTAVSAVKEIRAQQCEEWIKGKIKKSYSDYIDKRLSVLKVRYKRGTFFRLNTTVGITIYFALAAYGFYTEKLVISNFVASLFFCTTLIFAINGLVFNITEMLPTLDYVNALKTIFDVPLMIESKAENVALGSLKSSINIKINKFSYGLDKTILKNLSIKINKGEKILFIGESGVGKTTLLKIIAGMYKADDAEILWDTKNYGDIDFYSLQQRIGFMFQETYLFGESIFNNIKVGRPSADDSEVYAAAQKACIDSFIDELPDKIDTYVGERGTRLSGGQKQRIAIARLILKNPDVVVLDEITSSLDEDTERIIMKNIFCDVFRSKTIIGVSHRISVIPYFDRILFLSDSGLKEVRKDVANNLI